MLSTPTPPGPLLRVIFVCIALSPPKTSPPMDLQLVHTSVFKQDAGLAVEDCPSPPSRSCAHKRVPVCPDCARLNLSPWISTTYCRKVRVEPEPRCSGGNYRSSKVGTRIQ
ncbi:unnamed protein product [Ectocarpus sp. 4 AP-2014]